MTRRDWWIGIALVVAALLAHALFPRYEWSPQRGGMGSSFGMIRIDRWTGTTSLVSPTSGSYGGVPVEHLLDPGK